MKKNVLHKKVFTSVMTTASGTESLLARAVSTIA
jgi:hypothetical protein